MSNQLFWLFAISSVLSTSCPLHAQSEPGGQNGYSVPTGIRAAVTNWSDCMMQSIEPMLDGELTADSLLESAYDQCFELQQALDIANKQTGGRIERLGESERRRTRPEMISYINDRRSQSLVPTHPMQAWIFCVDSYVADRIESDAFDASFDSGVAQCKPLEAGIRSWIAETYGSRANSDEFWNFYLQEIRLQIRRTTEVY